MLLCPCIKSRADALANLPVPGQGGFRESGDVAAPATKTGTPLVNPPRCEPMEGFYMSANIIRPLRDEERALLKCYVTGSKQPASFKKLCDTMEVPADAEPDRLQIAVAQILLHQVQD